MPPLPPQSYNLYEPINLQERMVAELDVSCSRQVMEAAGLAAQILDDVGPFVVMCGGQMTCVRACLPAEPYRTAVSSQSKGVPVLIKCLLSRRHGPGVSLKVAWRGLRLSTSACC